MMISIIVPAFNVEKTIGKCLNSIISQTYKDLDVIVINDGSTDKTPQVCETYIKKDKRIRLINKANGGVSQARNIGLQMAKGEFVIFIDADDIMENDMIQFLYDNIVENNADCSICGASVIKDGCIIRYEYGTNEKVLLNKLEAIKRFLLGKKYNIGIWTKLYRKSSINGILFEEGRKINEDKYFIFEAILKSNSNIYYDVTKYQYILNEGSVTHKDFNESWFDTIYFAKKIYQRIIEDFPELEIYARYNLIFTSYCLISNIQYSKGAIYRYKKEYKDLLSELKTTDMSGVKIFFSKKEWTVLFLIRKFHFVYQIFKSLSIRLQNWR